MPPAEGIIACGIPVGSPAWVTARSNDVGTRIQPLLDFLPSLPHHRMRYQLLRYCILPCITHILRCVPPELTVPCARAHDRAVVGALCGILEEQDLPSACRIQAQLPLSLGGLGLSSQEAVRCAAYAGSWAACLRPLADMSPVLGDAIVSCLSATAHYTYPARVPGPLAQALPSWFSSLLAACIEVEETLLSFRQAELRKEPYMEGVVAMLTEVNRMQPTTGVYTHDKHAHLGGSPAQLEACSSFAHWSAMRPRITDPITLPAVCPPHLMLLGSIAAAQRKYSHVCGQLTFLQFYQQLGADFRWRFMSMGGPGASGWLTALHDNRRPWAPAAFLAALRLRLGLSIWQLREGGLLCGCHGRPRLTVDHCLTCSAHGYVTHRHNNLRDELAAAGVEVGYAGVAAGLGAMGTVREVPIPVPGAARGLKLDVELCTYREGGDGAEVMCGVDVAVVHATPHTLADGPSSFRVGHAARGRASAKHRKYSAYVGAGRIFRPAVWETYGRAGVDVLKLVDDISKSAWVRDEWGGRAGLTPKQATAQYRARLMQRCSFLLMQANVQYCLLRRARLALVFHRAAAAQAP